MADTQTCHVIKGLPLCPEPNADGRTCSKVGKCLGSTPTTVPAASERMTAEQRLKRLREFTTGERGPYTDLTNDIKAVLASLRLPQPDRAKADEGVDLHKVIATAFYEGCKRIWPKRRLPYKASLLSVAYADEVAPAIIRTLSARAEAAEARAERARAEALKHLAANVSDEMVAAGSVALPPPDEFGFWKTEDFRHAISAALSAAGDEDRRA